MTDSPRRLVRTSSELPANHWMARQLPPNTSLRGYAEDRAVSLLTRAVLDAIESAGLSRADVARALGTTKSYVSQVLNGSTNMTLKTLGALLWASGRQVSDLRTDVIGAPPRPERQQRQRSIAIMSATSRDIVWQYDTGQHAVIVGREYLHTNTLPQAPAP